MTPSHIRAMKMIEKITLALADRGLTQRGLEQRAGLSENRISKWKDGTGEPTARQALLMARLLGLPLEYLVDDDQEEVPAASPGMTADERAVLSYYRAKREAEGEGFSAEVLMTRCERGGQVTAGVSLPGNAIGRPNPLKAPASTE